MLTLSIQIGPGDGLITMHLDAPRPPVLGPHRLLMVALLLGAGACLPAAPALAAPVLAAPALAASRCWFGDPASAPAALPPCSTPPFSLDLINRFHLHILTVPTQGAGTIDFAITNTEEFMVVNVNFMPPLESSGTGPPLSGAFNYQLSIDPLDTDYFFSASLSVTPPPAAPPPEPAAIMLVQQIPEANASLDAGDHSLVSLYREPDPLKSITLLGNFTLNSGSLASIHNGFEIFVFVPPQAVPLPLPLGGAAMAWGYSRHLRRRLRLSRQVRRGSRIAVPPTGQSPRFSALAADRRQ